MGLKKVDRKIEQERKDVKRFRRIHNRRDENQKELADAVRDTRQIIDNKQRRRRKFRNDPKWKIHWSKARKDAARERLADEIEEAEETLDHLLEQLNTVQRKDQHAKEQLAKHKKRLNRLIRRRKEIRQNREGRLSKHFHVAEFDCRDGTRVPDYAIPALKALCRDVLEPQRAKFGSVRITSGYRTPSYNASVGGASNSIHCYNVHRNATAADHWCDRGSSRDWYNNTSGRADGRGYYSSFHHADNRNRIGWPDAVWSG